MMRFLIIFLLSLITSTLFAQGTSSAIASATIVSEVGITGLKENNSTAFATVNPKLKLTNTAGISMLANIKPVEVLSFKVISNENDFSITFPSTCHIAKKDDGLDYITAELFVARSLNRKNDQRISITFKGKNFQVPGNYYSSPFEITINYN